MRHFIQKEEYESLVADLDDQGLLELAGRMAEGLHMATPVFDGADEGDIRKLLVEAGVDEVGQSTLYDGLTGEPFDNKVTVGIMYYRSCTIWSTIKFMPVQPDRTLWLPSSRWVVRHNSVGSVWERWRFGPWKRMAQPTPCRNFLP